jgi:lipopolysaccharide transport protein LptA
VADVQAWGAKAQTGLVVVGRSTRLGRRISLDLRVRSSEDGRVLGTHVAEAPRPEDLGRAVEQLANEIIESAESVPSAVGSIPVAAVSAAPEGAPRAPAPGDSGPGPAADGTPEPSAGSSRKASPAPLAIQSDEMEVVQGEAGSRRFLFRNNVRLAQGDMHVFSRRMEAFYPAGADGGPNKMIATGGVRLRQSGRKATCDRATFYPRESRVVCEGRDAELVQGSDRVRGREIEFFLDTDRMIVRGGADVFLEPTTPAESPSAAGSGAAEGGE